MCPNVLQLFFINLWVDVGFPDSLVQELSDRAGELWGDLLWLVADVEVRRSRQTGLVVHALVLQFDLLVRLEEAGEHSILTKVVFPVPFSPNKTMISKSVNMPPST